jgi:hypothetical protein
MDAARSDGLMSLPKRNTHPGNELSRLAMHLGIEHEFRNVRSVTMWCLARRHNVGCFARWELRSRRRGRHHRPGAPYRFHFPVSSAAGAGRPHHERLMFRFGANYCCRHRMARGARRRVGAQRQAGMTIGLYRDLTVGCADQSTTSCV